MTEKKLAVKCLKLLNNKLFSFFYETNVDFL